jgi:DNA-binding response OmpR family regulator/tRNA A-37 threonylcarbamoyl transferase component Bud32
MKILLIDDAREFRKLARSYLGKLLPDAEVLEYDPILQGKPGADFDWSAFNVLLLDYNLGGGESGFTWLQEFSAVPAFPPTIILTAEGDEYIAVKAIKLGAANYLNKIDLTPRRLSEAVLEAALYNAEKIAEQEKHKAQAESVIHELQDQNARPRARSNLDLGYKVVRMIGEGAMSKVYLAERESDQLTVVLKVLEISDATADNSVIRFIQEAELISSLSSPFVVRIYDYGLTNDFGFIAMEFFSRGDLKQRMEFQLSPALAVNYLTHIVYGLEGIHRIGVVHRDLKPANLMFRGDDSMALADFGISKKVDAGLDITTTGKILGTPHYMSPEQASSDRIDHRADLYSAGVLFYELLTGNKPFTANTPAALIYQHLHSPIPQLPHHLKGLQHILDKTLAKNPEDRYQGAADLIKDLEIAEKKYG